jgi:hypothetical protein
MDAVVLKKHKATCSLINQVGVYAVFVVQKKLFLPIKIGQRANKSN